jgi:hypothetical protein
LCKKSFGEIIQKYKTLLSKPFEVHDETDRPAGNRLPFVHSDPDLVGFPRFKAEGNHDPLKLVEILPLLQLHGP